MDPAEIKALIENGLENADVKVYSDDNTHYAALVISDSEKTGDPPVVATAPFGYLRLRRAGYDDAALDLWAQRVKEQDWETAHVFFKHEDDCAGPALAAKFAERF